MIPKGSLETFSLKKVKTYGYDINFIKEMECNYMLSFLKIFVLYTHASRGFVTVCLLLPLEGLLLTTNTLLKFVLFSAF